MMKRVLLCTLIMMMVLGLPLFAGGNKEADGSITVSRWAGDPWEKVTKELAEEWQQKNDFPVTVDAIPWENLREKQILELSSGSSEYDVMNLHPSWYGEFVEAGYLLPLDDLIKNDSSFNSDNYITDIFKLGQANGKQYAFQEFLATILVAYRKDLFDEQGIPEPGSWEDLLAASKIIEEKYSIPGIVLPAKRGGTLTDVFSSILVSSGTWFFDDTNRPALDVARAANAIGFYKELVDQAPEGVLNYHWDEVATMAAQGQAGIIITLTTTLAWLDDPSRSSTVGKWAYAPIMKSGQPSGLSIYYNWGIAADTKNPQKAYEFLKWFTAGPQQARMAKEAYTCGSTYDFYANEELRAALPFMDAMQKALSNSKPQPSIKNWGAIQETLELSVYDVFVGRKSTEEAANDIDSAIKAALN